MTNHIAKRCDCWTRSVLLASAVLLAVPAPAQTVSGPSAEEIIVTASKRNQNALELPASVTLFDGEALAVRRVERVEEIAQITPNLEVAEFSDGQYRLIYRGIGATGTSDNQNFSTAIDQVVVPYGRAYRLLDLAQVEVLRGPQGTLYGRNTNAGVINIVPNDGRNGAPATLVAYAGTGGIFATRGAFGGTVGDSGVFFRAAGRYETRDGFVTNAPSGRDDAHSGTNGTGRFTLGWESGPWLARLSFTYDEYSGNSDDLTPVVSPRTSIAPDIGTSDGRMVLPILTVRRSGPVDITSITAFASTRRNLLTSAVVSPVLIGQFDSYESFSQELRLNGAGGGLGWLIGAYYLSETNDFRSTLTLVPLNRQLVDQNQRRKTDAGALFGELSYDLASRWRVTAGARLAIERQNVDYTAAAGAAAQNARNTYRTFQPKLALAYLLDGDGQIYGSVNRGFRAGSVFIGNAGRRDVAYDPENSWQYELGYKQRFADGAASFEAAAFCIDWSNLQVQRSIITSTTPFTIATIVDNATSARSWGAEAALNWRTASGLALALRGGFTDARYRQYDPAPGTSFADNRIELVPEYSTTASASYTFAEVAEIGFDLTHNGPMFFDAANSSRQSGYTVLDARVAWTLGPVRLAVVGRNLFDEAYASRGLVNAGATFAHFAPPRTVTVEAGLTF
ncbi:TonB-dependent receptor [Polymorphobacter sp.]|uniref:TonB-dependent receptor n=1 Tax=Polymorphobacter sp. TaxID=1909290 RepID=UPI003F6F5288